MDTTQEGLKLFALWLLAFVRFAGFFVQAPIWGSHHFDKKILVASAAVWTFIVFPHLPVPSEISFEPIQFILLVVTQVLVGLVIGFASFIVMAAAQFAGSMLDTQMGLSVAASYDPASGTSINMMQRMHFYLAMILFLCFNGHHFLIKAMFRSFDLIPLNGMHYGGSIVHILVPMSAQIFYLGVQLAAPALAALFITQIGLGMLARVAPQMNVFMLSFPLNIAIGLTIVSAGLLILLNALNKSFILDQAKIEALITAMKMAIK